MSDVAAYAAGIDTSRLEHRELELRGRTEPIGAWTESVSTVSVPATT